jgi:mannose-6-phosphate isomerase-like protein (cupin superfamily)
VILEGDGFKVKILEVLPGKRLSYQSHSKRRERWVVIEGKAEVTIEGESILKRRGDIVEVDIGEKHRLSNPGRKDLKIIEVQLGEYLGEDDIIRYEDDFGRK